MVSLDSLVSHQSASNATLESISQVAVSIWILITFQRPADNSCSHIHVIRKNAGEDAGVYGAVSDSYA